MNRLLFAVRTVRLIGLAAASWWLAGCATLQSRLVVDVGGSIRNRGEGWYIVTTGSHVPHNLQSVRTVTAPEGDYLEITHDAGASDVITFAVTADETMAKEGYTVGVSGGVRISKIYIYDRMGQTVNPLSYRNGNGNIWIYGKLLK